MPPIDCWMCKTTNHWLSVDAHSNHTETAFLHTIIACNESYTHYWHLILHSYVLSFASRSFVTSQYLINCYPRYLSERWRGPITFPRFWPATYGMWIISLILGKYSSTSSLFLIQLLLLDFQWRTISNFKYFNPVHEICVESYAFGYMDEYCMTVIIQADSLLALTTLSMTRVTSVT